MVIVSRTDNSIKNHWNSTIQRKLLRNSALYSPVLHQQESDENDDEEMGPVSPIHPSTGHTPQSSHTCNFPAPPSDQIFMASSPTQYEAHPQHPTMPYDNDSLESYECSSEDISMLDMQYERSSLFQHQPNAFETAMEHISQENNNRSKRTRRSQTSSPYSSDATLSDATENEEMSMFIPDRPASPSPNGMLRMEPRQREHLAQPTMSSLMLLSTLSTNFQ